MQDTFSGFSKPTDQNDISTWIDISSQIVKNIPTISVNLALYNPATKEVKIDISIDDTTPIANGATVITIPQGYRPSVDQILKGCGSAKSSSSVATLDWSSFYQIVISSSGVLVVNYTLGVSMYFFRVNFSYIVR